MPERPDLNESYAIQSFATLFQTLEDGQLNSDLSDDLRDQIVPTLQEALDTGVKRKIVINAKIELLADRGAIELSGNYTVKMPARSRRRTLMFTHSGKYLSRQDERQAQLPLRAVAENAQPLRNVE